MNKIMHLMESELNELQEEMEFLDTYKEQGNYKQDLDHAIKRAKVMAKISQLTELIRKANQL